MALTKKKINPKKSQGHKNRHRKVKCEIIQALIMINLHVKFIVHSSYTNKL